MTDSKSKNQTTSICALIQEYERDRALLSQVINEEIQQKLAALMITLNHMKHQNDQGSGEILTLAIQNLSEVMKDLRKISKELVPVSLDYFGLTAAMYELIETYRNERGVSIEFDHNVNNYRLKEQVEKNMYRVFHRALQNAMMDPTTSEVKIQLIKEEDMLSLIVNDNGSGEGIVSPSSNWLNMKNRIHSLKGTLHTYNAPGKGTITIAQTPLNEIKK